MPDPFLIDECLSPDLVALAHERGFDATHVVFRVRSVARSRCSKAAIEKCLMVHAPSPTAGKIRQMQHS